MNFPPVRSFILGLFNTVSPPVLKDSGSDYAKMLPSHRGEVTEMANQERKPYTEMKTD